MRADERRIGQAPSLSFSPSLDLKIFHFSWNLNKKGREEGFGIPDDDALQWKEGILTPQ